MKLSNKKTNKPKAIHWEDIGEAGRIQNEVDYQPLGRAGPVMVALEEEE